MTDLETIQKKILSFRNERDWAQFHDPKNLAEALTIEAGELLENFLWKTTEQSRNLSPEELKNVKEELADIFIFLTYLSEEYKIDLLSEVEKKIALNAAKYPIDKARGSSKKYTDLKDNSKSKGIYFIPAGTFMCIPLQFGHPFRCNSGTCSAAIQATVPLHFGHPLTHKTTLGKSF
ncbi:MAG: nucleotide pyrophosphohydrolase [Nitrospirota bacterium]